MNERLLEAIDRFCYGMAITAFIASHYAFFFLLVITAIVASCFRDEALRREGAERRFQ